MKYPQRKLIDRRTVDRDPYIDPWELENWCNSAERSRKGEKFLASGSASLPVDGEPSVKRRTKPPKKR